MKGYTMKIYKLIYPDTAENEYRVELDVEVVVTPPDYSNDVSDIDFYGSTELVDFDIISVQKWTCVQNPGVPRRKVDVLTYNWEDVLMEDLLPEEREELNELINKEVENECNC